MSVTIIIPVYEQWVLSRQCLAALAQQEELRACKVLVVDNGASLPQNHALEFQALGNALFGERFSYAPQSTNLNFAGACNLGAQLATNSFLCFLNNDTIPQPGWLAPLLAALQLPRVAAVGPLLLYPPDKSDLLQQEPLAPRSPRIQHLGISFAPNKKVSHIYEGFPAQHRVVKAPRSLQAITAAALLMPRELFLSLGGFDTAFINGFEDIELCQRLGQAQWQCACVTESVIWHYCGQSRGRGDHDAHNRAVLAQRQPSFFHPDEHLLLAADGYQLRPTPWLTWQPELAPRPLAQLNQQLARISSPPISDAHFLLKNQFFPLENSSPENAHWVNEQVEAEPFWHQGRQWLISYWQSRKPEYALELAKESLAFDTSPAPLLAVRKLALQLQFLAMAEHCQENLKSLLPSPDERLQKLREWRALLRGTCPAMVPAIDLVLSHTQ